MGFFDYIKNQFQSATLQPPPLPKPPKAPVTVPGYRSSVVAKKAAMAKPTGQSASLDRLATAKATTSEYNLVKALTRNSPELATSVSLKLRTAITETYTVVGKDLDGKIDRNATELAQELLRRLTFLGAADGSFGSQQGLQSLSETLALDLQHTGAACLEVALDKQRVPSSFNPVAVSTLTFYEEENSFRMVQKIGGEEIDLDVPNVIYVALDQVVTDAYPSSPLTAAIQPVLSDFDFNNDIRRALKRAVLPRLVASLDSEAVKKNTPPDILADPVKYANYQNALLSQVENVVNGLNPEDALVGFDYVDYKFIDGGHDPSVIIERVQTVLNAKLAAGAKALPVTLGFSSTSSGSSAESLLFLKECDGIRRKLNELYSRALTVAIRLAGVEGYVEFSYTEPDLRPSSELEAFRAMRQSRILELLSIGFMSDDEACLALTGHVAPAGMAPLSGTMFKGSAQVNPNPTSNTANATEKALAPETPTQPKTTKSA